MEPKHCRWRRTAIALCIVAAGTVTSVSTPVDADPPPTPTSAFRPLGPVRIADTRRPVCGCVSVGPTTVRLDLDDRPDVPDDAVAVAVTVTGLRTPSAGFVTVHPTGTDRPGTSTLNTRPDRTVANTTIVPLGDDGRIDVHRSQVGDVVVDLLGVFVPAATSRAGRFVPVAARRLVDTRFVAGPLPPGGEFDVPLPAEVDGDAAALLVNVTSLGERSPGHLSLRAAGSAPTGTSIVNPDGSGLPVAAATIVPVDRSGMTIRSRSGGHVVVDLLGWFTGPSAPERSEGLFVPSAPRRLVDTRNAPGRLHAGGTIEVRPPFAGAAAIVTNVTMTRPDARGFVTAHPAGRPRPAVSNLNASFWDHTVANFAVTRSSDRGTAYFARRGTDLVVDAVGWFTGDPVPATLPPPSNAPTRSRVLVVGDSTLGALDAVTEARAAFIGFDAVVDAAQCRRLALPSCRSGMTGLVPNTAVEAITGTRGPLDIVVVKTGYNDWFSDFPAEFDAVVRAARAKGAHSIVWMTYNERVTRPTARQAYRENNVDLRRLVELPQYPDVLLADWHRYSTARQDWFYDGTHLSESGAWTVADYIARWVAAIEHRPCPRPWIVGGVRPDPCPNPDLIGPVADARSLY